MNLLLDSHTFLWFCQGDASLSTKAKSLIEDAGNRKLLSVASCWEIAIKASLGKLKLGEPTATYLPAALSRTRFELLSLALAHVTGVEALPTHHKDPFDRLLIAQAIVEDLHVVSADSQFDFYPITRVW